MKQQRIQLPKVIFGTTSLGNIYHETPYATKLAIVKACVEAAGDGLIVFDSAGKYGAGMSLEVLGKCLKELGIPKERVVISNKLAWYRTELKTPEPTFEKGIWINIGYDAVQKISYQGIKDCFEQGNEFLGDYPSHMASVHDPDEYLANAKNIEEDAALYHDILEAYRALQEMKDAGKVDSIGVGSKQWKVIQRISKDVNLDWVMIANSLTLHSHPQELIDFIAELHAKGVSVINSAVFNGGFLIGSDLYNYHPVDKATEVGKALYHWRDQFFALCDQFGITPAEACFNFGFNIPGVDSVALSTSKPEKVKPNVEMATSMIPKAFWDAMKEKGLL